MGFFLIRLLGMPPVTSPLLAGGISFYHGGLKMSLVGLLIVCLIVGVGLYLLDMVPMNPTVKRIIRIVVILILVIYVILFIAGMFGLTTGMPDIRMR
jgi:hypothetical protein